MKLCSLESILEDEEADFEGTFSPGFSGSCLVCIALEAGAGSLELFPTGGGPKEEVGCRVVGMGSLEGARKEVLGSSAVPGALTVVFPPWLFIIEEKPTQR